MDATLKSGSFRTASASFFGDYQVNDVYVEFWLDTSSHSGSQHISARAERANGNISHPSRTLTEPCSFKPNPATRVALHNCEKMDSSSS
ncbi:MAG: hypothetical protein QXV01_12030 [Candidatus Bathyarchaeia archaeon]